MNKPVRENRKDSNIYSEDGSSKMDRRRWNEVWIYNLRIEESGREIELK